MDKGCDTFQLKSLNGIVKSRVVRQRVLIPFLLLSNLILLSVVVWQARILNGQKTRPVEMEREATKSLSNSELIQSNPDSGSGPMLKDPAEEFSPATSTSTNKNEISANWPRFDWRQVESEDYRTYIKNLRDIGCPEQTLRDIVSADLLLAFSAKREAAAKAAYQDFKFWEFNEEKLSELTRRRREIDSEMTDAMHYLLGTDVIVVSSTAQWTGVELKQALAFLPADKQNEINSVLAVYNNADIELPYPISRNRLTKDQAEELQQRLNKFDEKEAILKKVLTPEEYERLELTISPTANNLRHGMERFHPTEEEFRAIFPIWRAHDERIARLWAAGEPDPGNDYVFAAIEKILRPERFKEYRDTWWK